MPKKAFPPSHPVPISVPLSLDLDLDTLGRGTLVSGMTSGPDRRTFFRKENPEDIKERRIRANRAIRRMGEGKGGQEVGMELENKVDFPKRPAWKVEDVQVLEKREGEYFQEYIQGLYQKFGAQRLNYFEHNLEVWVWNLISIKCM